MYQLYLFPQVPDQLSSNKSDFCIFFKKHTHVLALIYKELQTMLPMVFLFFCYCLF